MESNNFKINPISEQQNSILSNFFIMDSVIARYYICHSPPLPIIWMLIILLKLLKCSRIAVHYSVLLRIIILNLVAPLATLSLLLPLNSGPRCHYTSSMWRVYCNSCGESICQRNIPTEQIYSHCWGLCWELRLNWMTREGTCWWCDGWQKELVERYQAHTYFRRECGEGRRKNWNLVFNRTRRTKSSSSCLLARGAIKWEKDIMHIFFSLRGPNCFCLTLARNRGTEWNNKESACEIWLGTVFPLDHW